MSVTEELLSLLPPPIVGAPVRRQSFREAWNMRRKVLSKSFRSRNIWGRDTTINRERQWYSRFDNIKPFQAANDDTIADSGFEIVPTKGTRPELDLPYDSGLVSTRKFYSQTYGQFEITATMPKGRGIWPAFWMLPEFDEWPKEFRGIVLPEIDIMEYIGDDTSRFYSTLHYYEAGIKQSDSYRHLCPDIDLTEGPHQYGFEWMPGYMAWYFDGTYRKVRPTPPYFNRPFHMIVNLAIGGTWPGTPELPEDLSQAAFKVHQWRALERAPIEDNPNFDIIERLCRIKQAHTDCDYINRLDQYLSELIA